MKHHALQPAGDTLILPVFGRQRTRRSGLDVEVAGLARLQDVDYCGAVGSEYVLCQCDPLYASVALDTRGLSGVSLARRDEQAV